MQQSREETELNKRAQIRGIVRYLPDGREDSLDGRILGLHG
jgi:hypothetical protein